MENNMKNLYRIILTLLLVISLVFSATSCDLLESLGVITGDSDSTDLPEDDSDEGADSGDTPGDEPDDLPEGDPEDTPDDDHDHNYVRSYSVAATCTENGYVIYVCECGNSFTANLSATGHSFVRGVCTACNEPDPDYDAGSDTEIFEGGILYLPNEVDPVTSDPYVNVDEDEFYANYTPAVSYMDAYYRTQHNLMSGSIDSQNPTPSISTYQPELDGMLIRNTTYLFSEDGKTYYVVNAYGEIVNKIYKCGAYVTLEEVAAYVFAFGTFPPNHSANKKTKPTESPWGKYLRVNHTNFTGDTSRYPYEPELPNITGCGGDLYYYEMDIGTPGYNNGTKISRGACRIVYTREDLDGDGVIEVGETYLFYTQNHYHDFREYLNYEGGWGIQFGDEAGGGVSRPTPYVETAYASFVYADGTPVYRIETVVMLWMPEREEV